mgnify:FL=1
MTTEHKAEMVASMIESIVKFGLTPSEIDVFINALDDLRDSLDTNLHEKLKEAMASPIARVIADPRDTQIRELTAERDKYRDACERLIGHYGAGSRWLCYDCEERGRCDDHQERVWDGPGVNGHDFARQVKAEIDGESK